MKGLKKACGEGEKTSYCSACYTGKYPTDIVDVEEILPAAVTRVRQSKLFARNSSSAQKLSRRDVRHYPGRDRSADPAPEIELFICRATRGSLQIGD